MIYTPTIEETGSTGFVSKAENKTLHKIVRDCFANRMLRYRKVRSQRHLVFVVIEPEFPTRPNFPHLYGEKGGFGDANKIAAP